jgi:hypothetical protein
MLAFPIHLAQGQDPDAGIAHVQPYSIWNPDDCISLSTRAETQFTTFWHFL